MKEILVLGAGRVARPCVQYLLKEPEYNVTVVDLKEENLVHVINGHPRGKGIVGNAGSGSSMLMDKVHPDLVVNLLPAAFMKQIAEQCIERGIPTVNPSYIDEDTKDLDEYAKDKGVTVLCELGLDPGIDHMSAVKTIEKIHKEGGKIDSFWSVCGAIPSAKDNTNPMGYKLSWAPAGLIGASKRDARFLNNGKEVYLPGGKTFQNIDLVEVEDLGHFEVYANGNALPYLDLYGIPQAKNIYRGTVRYLGWSETISKMLEMGLFEEENMALSGLTYRKFSAKLLGLSPEDGFEQALCRKLNIEPYMAIYKRLEWLGLFSEELIPIQQGSPRDVVSRLYFEKLYYEETEQDLVIMEHRFIAHYPASDRTVLYKSTMVDYGIAGGDTSVARTTGIPPAIGAKLILQGKVSLPGVIGPFSSDIYEPALDELEAENILFREKEELLEK
ncbi:MAG: saccharopine dehydrogenase NADP-binding domain-containing protein [Synergistales bacterium]|nr:saccharopine dehydrogenase NADP-binding domain-containing protein [Synergistales bacterium]